MNLRRRDMLLAAGALLVVGGGAKAVPLIDPGATGMIGHSRPRRLMLFNAHTGETFAGLYRDEAGPIPNAMLDLMSFLRDHREDKVGPVHVETLDFLADVLDGVGQTRATVLSAYRTPKTNAMLAAQLFGVAEKSQHLYGRAIDITLEARLRDAAGAARAMRRGGVGWYPQSHFIHLDSGPVRSWTIERSGLDKLLISRRSKRGPQVAERGQPNGPLTVRERIALQRKLAKQQMKERGR